MGCIESRNNFAVECHAKKRFSSRHRKQSNSLYLFPFICDIHDKESRCPNTMGKQGLLRHPIEAIYVRGVPRGIVRIVNPCHAE